MTESMRLDWCPLTFGHLAVCAELQAVISINDISYSNSFTVSVSH